MKLVLLAWLRESLRRPALALLSVAGVALGVATVVAVNIANDSASRSFIAANEAVSGNATHRISGNVTDELYRYLRVELGLAAVPVVEGVIRIKGIDDRFTLYGLDLLAEQSIRSNPAWLSLGVRSSIDLIANPYSIIATSDTAHRLSISAGDMVEVTTPEGDFKLSLVNVYDAPNPLQQQSLQSVLLTDVATAQSVLGMTGRLSSIQLTAKSLEELESLSAILPDDTYLESNSGRTEAQKSMVSAFQINLTALGLLALLVAMFLIYNTMSFMVLRRRRMIGIARSAGLLKRDVMACVLIEAFSVGCLSTILGVVFGMQLSKFLLSLIEQSIGALYFPINANVTVVSPDTLATAIFLGIGATLLSVLPAAREASFTLSTYQTSIDQKTPNISRKLALAGLVLLVAGTVVIFMDSRSIVLGFSGIFLIIIGYMLNVPFLIHCIERFTRPGVKKFFGIQGILVTRAFSSSLNKTSIAVAALSLAISATIGVGLMIGSFRMAVDGWLENRLTGDIYITTSASLGEKLHKADLENLRELPDIDSIGTARWVKLRTTSGGTWVFAVDYGKEAFRGFDFKEQSSDDLWEPFRNGGVIISEPYAYKNNLQLGDMIRFLNNKNTVALSIIGIYYDYSSDQGIVTMHRDAYVEHFGDKTVTTAAVFAEASAEIKELAEAVEKAVLTPEAKIWRNRELHDSSLKIFDQTFAITGVLRTLAIIVAFIAVLSALAILQIEREKELAVLRATGFTVNGIWRSASLETGVMGLFAAIVSIPIGIVMAWLLIWIINQRSFGWTMQISLDSFTLVQAVAVSFTAALLASAVPAWRLSRRVPAQALQGVD